MKNNGNTQKETTIFPINIANNVLIYETKIDSSFAIGNLILDTLKNNPKTSIGLSIGNMFKDIFTFIATNKNNAKVSFANAKIFLMTEFVNSNDSELTLFNWFQKNFLTQIDTMAKNTFVISSEKSNNSTNLDIIDFKKTLVKHAPIDIELLHLGTNGSIAFNEPSNDSSTINNLTGISILSSSSINELSSYLETKSCPKKVLTMGTLEVINAKKIIIPAYGAIMIAPLVKLLTANKYDPNWPITALIYAQSDVKIYLDKTTYDLLLQALKK